MTDSNSPEELSALKSETQAQLVTKQPIKRKAVIPQVNELAASIGSTIDILSSVNIAAKLTTTKFIQVAGIEPYVIATKIKKGPCGPFS